MEAEGAGATEVEEAAAEEVVEEAEEAAVEEAHPVDNLLSHLQLQRQLHLTMKED